VVLSGRLGAAAGTGTSLRSGSSGCTSCDLASLRAAVQVLVQATPFRMELARLIVSACM
jgi:hypothetical protein